MCSHHALLAFIREEWTEHVSFSLPKYVLRYIISLKKESLLLPKHTYMLASLTMIDSQSEALNNYIYEIYISTIIIQSLLV